MSRLRIVLDTNVLLICLPKKSTYRKIFDAFLEGKFELLITNEIISEYVEKIEEKTNYAIANNLGELLVNNEFSRKVEVHIKWNLIESDYDDNKFVDCCIAGQGGIIVTNDKDFKRLEEVKFPSIQVLNADQFLLRIATL